MIFDFEPWQLDIDIDLTKQLFACHIRLYSMCLHGSTVLLLLSRVTPY